MDHDISLKDAAIQMERKMAQYYRSAALRASDERARDVWSYLADEELNHARELEELTAVETNTECLNQAFEEAGDIMKYLLTEPGVPEEASGPAPSEEEVLSEAIQAEKDSILFYHSLLRALQREDLAEQIEGLIGFEYGHLNRLYTLLEIVRKSS